MSLTFQQEVFLARLFDVTSAKNVEKTCELAIDKEAVDALEQLTFDLNYRGYWAYKTHGLELACRTLAGTYPVIQQLVGAESFTALAAALWQAHPPERGDLAYWGGDLAEFARNSPQLAEEPYLPDVAVAEWALHQLKTAPDEVTDHASLQLLMTSDPAVIALRLTKTAQSLTSSWPLASLWLVHQFDATMDSPWGGPDFESVGVQIRQKVAQTALVWRDGHKPRLREAMPGEVPFISAIQQGCSLDRALDGTALDFSTWLPLAVKSGLLLGAASQPASIEVLACP